MSRRRFGILIVAALIAIVGALYLGSVRDSAPPSVAGAPLLPAVSAQLGSVSEVDIRKGSATPGVTLHRSGDQWMIAQRGDYPADGAKVKRLLISLVDTKIVETKTANPANFTVIGVEDPGQAGATGTEITLVAKDGKHAVIVGKPIGEGNFARRGGENQTYTIEPGVSADAEPRAWIDSKLIDVQTSAIQSVELKPSSGTGGYLLRRSKPNEDGFALDGAPPAGRKLADAKALGPSTMTLSGLNAEDVAAAADIDFSKPTHAIFTLADGNVITISGVAVNDKRWIEVQASKDAPLSTKAQNRAFEIASYRYDAVFRPLEQLLVPKEPPPDTKNPSKLPIPAARSNPGAMPAPQASPAPTP
jgi:Domain of unknown function (DUF4340)